MYDFASEGWLLPSENIKFVADHTGAYAVPGASPIWICKPADSDSSGSRGRDKPAVRRAVRSPAVRGKTAADRRVKV